VFDGAAPASGDGMRSLYREHADAPPTAKRGREMAS
jgi:hypothetical protein